MTVVACSSSSITRGEVQFDFEEFIGLYPEFTTANEGQSQNMFNLATLNLSNCCGSIVPDANVRQSLLYLLTAHLIFLFVPCGANNNVPPGLVGKISSATEGSVSVSVDFPQNPEGAWFNATKYGALFFQTTTVIRAGGHYIPPVNSCGCGSIGPFDIGLGPGWDNGGWLE